MDIWQLYLIEAIPSIVNTIMVLGGFALLGSGAAALFVSMENNKVAVLRKIGVFSAATALVMVIASAVPSRHGLYRIIGGYYVTNLENISDLPENAVGAANAFLKHYSEKHAK